MKKILVIDDEKSTLAMCRLFLSTYGYEVYTAENESEGLEIFTRERPPIVLTDIKMPKADGFSVLEKIKTLEPKTEVIVITGHGDKDLAERAFKLGASDFLNKPLQTEAFEEAMQKAEKKVGL